MGSGGKLSIEEIVNNLTKKGVTAEMVKVRRKRTVTSEDKAK